MASVATPTFVAKSVDQKTVDVYLTVAVSASTYTFGGIAFDLSSVLFNNGVVASRLLDAKIQDNSGFQYRYVPGTAANFSDGLFQIFGQQPTSTTSGVIALTEFPNATTVPTGVSGSTSIKAKFTFLREN